MMQSPDLERLLATAAAAAAQAYAPYSGFRVGAALLLHTGEIVTGANIENSSYGLTLCAERSALARAIAKHGPRIRVASVAIANLNRSASPPCGACRQVLAEFCSPDTPVAFPVISAITGDVETQICTFGELFPYTFNLPATSL